MMLPLEAAAPPEAQTSVDSGSVWVAISVGAVTAPKTGSPSVLCRDTPSSTALPHRCGKAGCKPERAAGHGRTCARSSRGTRPRAQAAGWRGGAPGSWRPAPPGELQAHKPVEQGQPVTTETLNALHAGLFKQDCGDAVTLDDFQKLSWARIPHFFNSPCYVYQCATCFASSVQIFKDMATGPDPSRRAETERDLTLLRSGGKDHPMAQLKMADMDLTRRATTQAVIDQLDALVTCVKAEVARIR